MTVAVPWVSTEGQKPARWSWAGREGEPVPQEELAACRSVAAAVGGLEGLVVADLGCGRGATLRAARDLGAVGLVGVDREAAALRTSALAVMPAELTCVAADLLGEVPLPDGCADLVWSHGVVEHFRPGEVERVLALHVRLSRRWVAVSAPNPACRLYRAFRAARLAAGSWLWGYEEPLYSYAPLLETLGMRVVLDVDVARLPAEAAAYAQGVGEGDGLLREHARGTCPGVYTLCVAEVACPGSG